MLGSLPPTPRRQRTHNDKEPKNLLLSESPALRVAKESVWPREIRSVQCSGLTQPCYGLCEKRGVLWASVNRLRCKQEHWLLRLDQLLRCDGYVLLPRRHRYQGQWCTELRQGVQPCGNAPSFSTRFMCVQSLCWQMSVIPTQRQHKCAMMHQKRRFRTASKAEAEAVAEVLTNKLLLERPGLRPTKVLFLHVPERIKKINRYLDKDRSWRARARDMQRLLQHRLNVARAANANRPLCHRLEHRKLLDILQSASPLRHCCGCPTY